MNILVIRMILYALGASAGSTFGFLTWADGSGVLSIDMDAFATAIGSIAGWGGFGLTFLASRFAPIDKR
ncbi:hypothetical protein I5535_08215 [Rhodobacteraceae bacterium F11138]|nr:hypothetical protein [Rhodobacteraceae bacterium F11138]